MRVRIFFYMRFPSVCQKILSTPCHLDFSEHARSEKFRRSHAESGAHFPSSVFHSPPLPSTPLFLSFSIFQERRHERLDWNRGRSIHVWWQTGCVCRFDRHERPRGWGRRLITLNPMYAVPNSYDVVEWIN